MRAIVCKEYGPPEALVLEERDSPALKPTQVRVAVRACGVNFPDTLIIQGKYQFKPPMPFTPGGEVAGEVTEVGDKVSGFAVGDKVIGMMLNGGYADEIVFSPAQLTKMPDGVSFEAGAAIPTVYGTTIHALKDRADLQAGETLAVLGASGGVGMAAVQLGKIMGAKVIAVGGDDDKLAACRDAGADEVINYQTEDLKKQLKALSGGKGVDVIYDAVGGDAFEAGIRAMAWNGRMLVVGFASGEIPKLPVNLLLLKGCQAMGVFWGQFAMQFPRENAANMQQVLDWVAAGKLDPPIWKTYPLEDAAGAMNALLSRKVVGKVVLTTG